MPKVKAPASSKRGGKPTATSTEPELPNWPPFKPLCPPGDLNLEPLLENQLVVARNFFTSTLCKNYVKFLKTLPLVTTPGKPKKGDAVRVNDRFQINDPAFANRLWLETGLKELVIGGDEEGGEEGGMTAEEKRKMWYVHILGEGSETWCGWWGAWHLKISPVRESKGIQS